MAAPSAPAIDSANTRAASPPLPELRPSPSALEFTYPPKPVNQGQAPADIPKHLEVAEKNPRRTRLRLVLRRVGSFFVDVLTGIWICFAYGIPGLLILIISLVPIFILSFAITAAIGAIMLLTGNAILRAAHLLHYTTDTTAAKIGAVGGVISGLISTIVSHYLPRNPNNPDSVWWPFSLGVSVLEGTLAGTIGSAVLQSHHVDLHGIDVLHATRAGALGGTILGPGVIVAIPLMFAALFILFSPLIIAMKLGLSWLYIHSNETWSDRGCYTASYCHCYGSCRDDPEIEEELVNARRLEQRVQAILDPRVNNSDFYRTDDPYILMH